MEDQDLGALLSIIITTSPSPLHPSTELLQTVLCSLRTHAPELTACRMLIVCDGTKPATKSNFRSGKVDESAAAAYVLYKSRLRDLITSKGFEFGHVELLELEGQHGFGCALLISQLLLPCHHVGRLTLSVGSPYTQHCSTSRHRLCVSFSTIASCSVASSCV